MNHYINLRMIFCTLFFSFPKDDHSLSSNITLVHSSKAPSSLGSMSEIRCVYDTQPHTGREAEGV